MALKKEGDELMAENLALRAALKERIISLGMSRQALHQSNTPISINPLSLQLPAVNTNILYK